MTFEHTRTVRFHETDAAGVVYFANLLVFCHEAYEASLAASGIDLATFFSGGALAYPVVHASVDFRRPLQCGDCITLALVPYPLDPASFEIHYQLWLTERPAQPVATALTRHVCIATRDRARTPLPAAMLHWLSQVGQPPPAP